MVKRKVADSAGVPQGEILGTSTTPAKRKKIVASHFHPVDPEVLPADSRLDVSDGEIYYIEDFVAQADAKRWYKQLLDLDTWYQPTLNMYGRSFLQSRQIVAYGSEESPDEIKYSGTEVPLKKDHPAVLREIQGFLESKLKTTFNHCMLNRYDDGSVYIGSHSDNLENLCIASISLGAPRDFILQHKKPPVGAKNDERYRRRWPLGDGSLVIMQGDTQKHWKHEIPKQLKIKTGRISLTFRQLIDK